jgi:hypothetical protein
MTAKYCPPKMLRLWLVAAERKGFRLAGIDGNDVARTPLRAQLWALRDAVWAAEAAKERLAERFRRWGDGRPHGVSRN